MPRILSFSIFVELLAVGLTGNPPADGNDDAWFPFCDASFLAAAGLDANPWVLPPDGSEHQLGWKNDHIQAGREFVHNYMELDASKTGRNREFKSGMWPAGEAVWIELTSKYFGTDFIQTIDDGLRAAGIGVDAILQEMTMLPSLPDLIGTIRHVDLRSILFEDGVDCDRRYADQLAGLFRNVAEGVARNWNSTHNVHKAHYKKLRSALENAYKPVENLSLEGVTLPAVRRVVKAYNALKDHIVAKDWICYAEVLSDYNEWLERVAGAVGIMPSNPKGIPLGKAFLDQLRTQKKGDLDALIDDINGAFVEASEGDAAVDFDTQNLGDTTASWEKGVGRARISQFLGLVEEGVIPNMVRWVASDPSFNSFTEGDLLLEFNAAVRNAEQGIATPAGPRSLKPFLLLDYQLECVAEMADWFMEHESGLLLDDVGLGKTVQVLALSALLVEYARTFEAHGRFPGGKHYRFMQPGCNGDNKTCPVKEHDCSIPGIDRRCSGDSKTCKFRHVHGNIPNFPSLVYSTGTISSQWHDQARTLLQNGRMTVLPFFAPSPHMRTFINENHVLKENSVFHSCGLWACLIVASIKAQVVEADFLSVTGWAAGQSKLHKLHDPYPPIPADMSTLYHQRYNLLVPDELHLSRTPTSLKFNALLLLGGQAQSCISLTATPIVTTIIDAPHCALLVGQPQFQDPVFWKEAVVPRVLEVRRIGNKVKAAMRRAEKKLSAEAKADARRKLVASGGMGLQAGADTAAAVGAAKLFRSLVGNVIHRSIKDVHADKDMPPRTLVVLYIHPGARERIRTKEVVDKLMGDITPDSTLAAFAQHFYIDGRRIAIHYALSPLITDIKASEFPSSIQEYNQHASAKLSALRHLVRVHTENRQLPPQQVRYERGVMIWFNGQWDPPLREGEMARVPSKPQKIVVYSYFRDAVEMIARLLTLDGHSVYAVAGDTAMGKHSSVLVDWRMKTSAAILVVTKVAATGINLQEADILIIMDPQWSASEDAQLEGRIFRKGQKSRTILYMPLLAGSTDGSLRQIADPKKQYNDAFIDPSSVEGEEGLQIANAAYSSSHLGPDEGYFDTDGITQTLLPHVHSTEDRPAIDVLGARRDTDYIDGLEDVIRRDAKIRATQLVKELAQPPKWPVETVEDVPQRRLTALTRALASVRVEQSIPPATGTLWIGHSSLAPISALREGITHPGDAMDLEAAYKRERIEPARMDLDDAEPENHHGSLSGSAPPQRHHGDDEWVAPIVEGSSSFDDDQGLNGFLLDDDDASFPATQPSVASRIEAAAPVRPSMPEDNSDHDDPGVSRDQARLAHPLQRRRRKHSSVQGGAAGSSAGHPDRGHTTSVGRRPGRTLEQVVSEAHSQPTRELDKDRELVARRGPPDRALSSRRAKR
ncbi:hypothetical protein AURDEDRAFT_121902 [Auricularia subglabra TFB-10046 SS5]|nr:hypothetical protein AURDEDRAFT_121902 [Auricularia subglabra TFB-10046 SS5]